MHALSKEQVHSTKSKGECDNCIPITFNLTIATISSFKLHQATQIYYASLSLPRSES